MKTEVNSGSEGTLAASSGSVSVCRIFLRSSMVEALRSLSSDGVDLRIDDAADALRRRMEMRAQHEVGLGRARAPAAIDHVAGAAARLVVEQVAPGRDLQRCSFTVKPCSCSMPVMSSAYSLVFG